MSTTLEFIIPSYGASPTARLLRNLAKLPISSYPITVAEDSVGAGPYDVLSEVVEQMPNVRVTRNKSNLGFGANCNRALEESKANLVWFLNSDVLFDSVDVERQVELFRENTKLAAINHVTSQGNFNRGSWGIPGPYSLKKLSSAYKVLGNSQLSPMTIMDGSSLVVSRTAFLEVGGFKPIYGRGYYEDADLGLSLKTRGFDIGLDEKTFYFHSGGSSFGEQKSQLIKKNVDVFESQWGSREKLWKTQHLQYPLSIADMDFISMKSVAPKVILEYIEGGK